MKIKSFLLIVLIILSACICGCSISEEYNKAEKNLLSENSLTGSGKEALNKKSIPENEEETLSENATLFEKVRYYAKSSDTYIKDDSIPQDEKDAVNAIIFGTIRTNVALFDYDMEYLVKNETYPELVSSFQYYQKNEKLKKAYETLLEDIKKVIDIFDEEEMSNYDSSVSEKCYEERRGLYMITRSVDMIKNDYNINDNYKTKIIDATGVEPNKILTYYLDIGGKEYTITIPDSTIDIYCGSGTYQLNGVTVKKGEKYLEVYIVLEFEILSIDGRGVFECYPIIYCSNNPNEKDGVVMSPALRPKANVNPGVGDKFRCIYKLNFGVFGRDVNNISILKVDDAIN